MLHTTLPLKHAEPLLPTKQSTPCMGVGLFQGPPIISHSPLLSIPSFWSNAPPPLMSHPSLCSQLCHQCATCATATSTVRPRNARWRASRSSRFPNSRLVLVKCDPGAPCGTVSSTTGPRNDHWRGSRFGGDGPVGVSRLSTMSPARRRNSWVRAVRPEVVPESSAFSRPDNHQLIKHNCHS